MKKVFSLIMVLALVLCLATVALAAEPATLVMGTNTATSDVDDFVTYTWTASGDGVLTLSFSDDWIYEVADGEGTVVSNGNSAWSSSPAAQIDVTKDVTYTVKVGVLNNPFEGTAKAGTVVFEASFCDGTKENPYVLPAVFYNPEAHSGKWFYFKADAAGKLIIDCDGVVITDGEGNTVEIVASLYGGYSAAVEMAAGDELYLNITNVEGAEWPYAQFDYAVKGSYGYPYEAVLGTNYATSVEGSYETVNFAYVATESGQLTLTIKNPESGWIYNFGAAYRDFIENPEETSYTCMVTAGETYMLSVAAYAVTEDGYGYITSGTVEFELSLSTLGTENDPIFVENEITSIKSFAGADVYYAFSSRLNGATVMIAADEWGNLAVTVNDVALEADGGYFTFTLDSAPVTKVVLSNNGWVDAVHDVYFTYPEGSYNNPISVNVPGDLTSANVAAGAEVWYAVSGRLNGTVLTVEGEGAYVIVNGTRVDAVDGVVTVNLAAEGAVIPVVIGNAGEEDAEFDCQIKYPPVEINAAGSYEAQVAAGAEVAYLVNSRLDGYVLTVEGEDAYVIVNGEKVEAVDGVVTVTLEAKGATIPVFVGNAGDAAATYTVVISAADTSPETGDMIAAALVLMLTSGAAVVCLKKKEN